MKYFIEAALILALAVGLFFAIRSMIRHKGCCCGGCSGCGGGSCASCKKCKSKTKGVKK